MEPSVALCLRVFSAHQRELLRAESSLHCRAGRWMLHLRTRGFSNEDVALRVDREVVWSSKLAGADARPAKFAHHLQITSAQDGDEV